MPSWGIQRHLQQGTRAIIISAQTGGRSRDAFRRSFGITYPFPILLDLGDGREPIPCRDERQADLLRGLWCTWTTTQEQRQEDKRRRLPSAPADFRPLCGVPPRELFTRIET